MHPARPERFMMRNATLERLVEKVNGCSLKVRDHRMRKEQHLLGEPLGALGSRRLAETTAGTGGGEIR